MKKIVIFIFAINFISGCSTNPYLKKSELPSKITYYSRDKQFKVKPEWYWRMRPTGYDITTKRETYFDPADSTFLGYKYLADKKGNGLVIGELSQKNRIFYVIKWENHGYFFVDKSDYNFDQKFKKYFIPLNYNSEYFYTEGSDGFLFVYYSNYDNLMEGDKNFYNYIVRLGGKESNLNTMFLLELSFRKTLFKNKFFRKNYSELINKEVQLYIGNIYKNMFLQFRSCPLLKNFCGNDSITNVKGIVMKKSGETTYTNEYGNVMQGIKLVSESVIVKWGDVYYALPCN